MEIIHTKRKTSGGSKTRAQHLYLGIMLIVVGVILILYNFQWIGYRLFDIFFSWPMLLSVAGGYLLVIRKQALGIATLAVGLFFVATGFLDFDIPVRKIVLPLAFMLGGVAVIFQKIRPFLHITPGRNDSCLAFG
ncbi:MAG: DUF5668 domain-containing protein [Rikenellaceae bacterium]|nr:DUF5668 domain-containing protein [Rikenellaceae bacterium]